MVKSKEKNLKKIFYCYNYNNKIVFNKMGLINPINFKQNLKIKN